MLGHLTHVLLQYRSLRSTKQNRCLLFWPPELLLWFLHWLCPWDFICNLISWINNFQFSVWNCDVSVLVTRLWTSLCLFLWHVCKPHCVRSCAVYDPLCIHLDAWTIPLSPFRLYFHTNACHLIFISLENFSVSFSILHLRYISMKNFHFWTYLICCSVVSEQGLT